MAKGYNILNLLLECGQGNRERWHHFTENGTANLQTIKMLSM